MTRFARAKGSKSSNERKPEEATSWSEMKSSMLLKKCSDKTEKLIPEENKKVEAPKKTEWASLGDDALSESVSLIKQHLGRKDGSLKAVEKGKKKNKSLDNVEKQLNSSSISKQKLKNKKLKNPDSLENGVEVKEKKKGKKRTLKDEGENPEAVHPKKRKVLKNNEESGLGGNKNEKKNDYSNKKSSKEHQKMKSKYHKSQNGERNFNSRIENDSKRRKKFKNKNFQERKSEVEELIINGEKIPITKFQGFYVTLEDAERLKKLRSEMIKEGIPKGKMEAAIKLERRRAEKALSRLKKSVCFHCRDHGHLLSNCPKLLEKENTGTGICYKCGSTEHSATECKVVRGTNYQFAECFICKEQGHIARQCPDNPRGLYPQGGACRECGDVTHLRKDCPKVQAQKAEDVVTVGLRRERDLECLDEEIAGREKINTKKKVEKKSAVKF